MKYPTRIQMRMLTWTRKYKCGIRLNLNADANVNANANMNSNLSPNANPRNSESKTESRTLTLVSRQWEDLSEWSVPREQLLKSNAPLMPLTPFEWISFKQSMIYPDEKWTFLSATSLQLSNLNAFLNPHGHTAHLHVPIGKPQCLLCQTCERPYVGLKSNRGHTPRLPCVSPDRRKGSH